MRRVWVVGLLAAAWAGPGCGPAEVRHKVTGRLTDGGVPLRAAGPAGRVVIELVPESSPASGGPRNAREVFLNADGTFEASADGRGVPPGRYKVVVRHWDPFPRVDRLGGRFALERTPIALDVRKDEVLDIDVSRPGG